MSDEKKLVAVIVELFSLKENAPSKINGSTSPSNEESTKRTNIKTSKTRQKKKHTNFRKTEYTRSKTMVKTLFHLILKDDPGHHDKEQQDGNVPSRRHILGSKIFKEQLLEKFGKKFFFKKKNLIFFRKKKYFLGRTMPKNSLKNLWFSAGFEPMLSGWVEDER